MRNICFYPPPPPTFRYFFSEICVNTYKKWWKIVQMSYFELITVEWSVLNLSGFTVNKYINWINYHHNKNSIARILWNVHENFSMIPTKRSEIRLQPLQSNFVTFFRQVYGTFPWCKTQCYKICLRQTKYKHVSFRLNLKILKRLLGNLQVHENFPCIINEGTFRQHQVTRCFSFSCIGQIWKQ